MKRRSFTQKLAIWSAAGMAILILLVLLSFCGSVNDAPDDEDEKSEATAEAFELSISGDGYSIDDYNDGDEKSVCTSFKLRAKADAVVREIFFSTSPLETETEITVLYNDTELMRSTAAAMSSAVKLPLDVAVTNGSSFELRFTAPICVQSVFVEFGEI